MVKMREVLNIQKQLVPDLIDQMKKRYKVLNHVLIMCTAGRRTLAASLDMSERVLRAEADFLKEQGLLRIESTGITITAAVKSFSLRWSQWLMIYWV